MATDYDFVQLYVRLEKLDKELKELRNEVGEIKSAIKPKKQWVPQWEEDIFEDDTN